MCSCAIAILILVNPLPRSLTLAALPPPDPKIPALFFASEADVSIVPTGMLIRCSLELGRELDCEGESRVGISWSDFASVCIPDNTAAVISHITVRIGDKRSSDSGDTGMNEG